MAKTVSKRAKGAASKTVAAPLERAVVTRINGLVSRLATAASAFQAGVVKLATEAGPTTESDWQGRYAPVFQAALEKHTTASAYVMLGRIKSLFLCAANKSLPKGDDGQPRIALTAQADDERRAALRKAKVLPPKGTGKGANKRKAEKPKAKAPANDRGNLLDPASVKPGKAYTEADMRGAGIILTGTPKLASELAALLVNDKDAPAEFKKLLRVFVDGRKSA